MDSKEVGILRRAVMVSSDSGGVISA